MRNAAGRYLGAGVSWAGDGAFLALRSPGGESPRQRLDAGTVLAYRVLPGENGALRHCLGSVKVQDRNTRIFEPCPGHCAAERGYQRGRCFARDDWRLIHNSHRSGIAPPGLKLYLAQPHWLDVATFADGTTKVGTAVLVRVEGSDTPFIADLSRLKGRRLHLGSYRSQLPALQPVLF